MFPHSTHPPLISTSCLVEQNRSIYLHGRKSHIQMTCCDKTVSQGDLERRGDIPDSYSLATAAVGCLVSCGSTYPVSLKSPLQEKQKKTLQWGFYMHTYTLNLSTKTYTATLQWHSKQYRRKLRLNKHMLCTGAVHTYNATSLMHKIKMVHIRPQYWASSFPMPSF